MGDFPPFFLSLSFRPRENASEQTPKRLNYSGMRLIISRLLGNFGLSLCAKSRSWTDDQTACFFFRVKTGFNDDAERA